jgi:hypothetical protein
MNINYLAIIQDPKALSLTIILCSNILDLANTSDSSTVSLAIMYGYDMVVKSRHEFVLDLLWLQDLMYVNLTTKCLELFINK